MSITDSKAEVSSATNSLLFNLTDGAAHVHDSEGARLAISDGDTIHKGEGSPYQAEVSAGYPQDKC